MKASSINHPFLSLFIVFASLSRQDEHFKGRLLLRTRMTCSADSAATITRLIGVATTCFTGPPIITTHRRTITCVASAARRIMMAVLVSMLIYADMVVNANPVIAIVTIDVVVDVVAVVIIAITAIATTTATIAVPTADISASVHRRNTDGSLCSGTIQNPSESTNLYSSFNTLALHRKIFRVHQCMRPCVW